MWLSRTIAARQRAERESAAADMGVTTIGGGSASVMTKGEQRNLEVFAPGGLIWQPQAGDTVLVIKGGTSAWWQPILLPLPQRSWLRENYSCTPAAELPFICVWTAVLPSKGMPTLKATG